jgi:hypothetical protein
MRLELHWDKNGYLRVLAKNSEIYQMDTGMAVAVLKGVSSNREI